MKSFGPPSQAPAPNEERIVGTLFKEALYERFFLSMPWRDYRPALVLCDEVFRTDVAGSFAQ
jgi:hypothetical protein